MQPLILEYVLDGYRRGYNFTSPTHGYEDTALKTIWRNAMPRGQGWGAERYRGARSFKAFPLNEKQVAFSAVTVTDQQDEQGRRGIRRAVIDVYTGNECLEHLRAMLGAYPDDVRARLERKPTLGQWMRIVDESLPKLRRDAQVIVTRPFACADDWQLIEAFVLKVVTARPIPLSRWGKIIPFTTLALDHRDESRVVALPSQQLANGDELSVVRVQP